MMNLSVDAKVSQWGNSKAVRLPLKIAETLGFNTNDKVKLSIDEDKTGVKRLVISKASDEPQTIKELFADYAGGSFKSELVELKATGNEAW